MLANILKWCSISKTGNDDKNFAAHQISFLGKVSDAVVISPYGMHSNIPLDSLSLVCSIQGHSANKAILGVTPKDRPELKEGEVAIYHQSGSTIILKDNGDIDLTPGSGVINMSGDANISGDLAVSGNTALADVTSNGVNIGSTHTHTGSPTAPDGPVAPTGVPS